MPTSCERWCAAPTRRSPAPASCSARSATCRRADVAAGVFVIKPSGVPYEELTAAHMVPVSLETGEALESTLRPSSDTPTHLELYRAFRCGGIVHTHSESATILAQARVPLRCMGTTHADYFRGDVPVTRPMRSDGGRADYERNTGLGDRRDVSHPRACRPTR